MRMARTERKISRIALGEAIGLTDQQIQKYETGTNRIGVSRLQQICKVLEIPVSFLFEGTLGSPPAESAMPQRHHRFHGVTGRRSFVAGVRKDHRPENAARHRAAARPGSPTTCSPKRRPTCCQFKEASDETGRQSVGLD